MIEPGLTNPNRPVTARSLVFGALRLILVLAAIVWTLLGYADLQWRSPEVAKPVLLAAGLAVNQLALAVFAVRMQLVLKVLKVQISWGAALRIHLQSMFYFFVLPMSVGLEVSRFVKIRRIQPTATLAQLSSALLFDRLIGAGSASAVALLCLPFVTVIIPPAFPSWAWIAGGAVTGLIVALALGSSRRARELMIRAWRIADGHWPTLGVVFVISMAMHLIFAVAVQLLAKSIALPLSFLDTIFAVSGGMLLVAIPVSLAGLGPADAGAAGLLIAAGYPAVIAATAAILPYLARLVAAIEGAAWEMIEGGSSAVAATRRLFFERASSP